MGKLMLDGVEVGLPDRSVTAGGVSFDPTVKNILPNTATDVQKAIDAVSEKIKTYSFTATAGSNGTLAIPTPPADLNFVIGATYSGGGYVYILIGAKGNTNPALMLLNSDGTKMSGTFNFTIAYI